MLPVSIKGGCLMKTSAASLAVAILAALGVVAGPANAKTTVPPPRSRRSADLGSRAQIGSANGNRTRILLHSLAWVRVDSPYSTSVWRCGRSSSLNFDRLQLGTDGNRMATAVLAHDW